MSDASAATFRRTLRARLGEYARRRAALGEPTTDGTAVHLPSADGGVVVAVVEGDVYPRERAVVERARETATDLGASWVATCDRADLFLEGVDVADRFHVDLRDGLDSALGTLLDALDHAHDNGTLPSQPPRDWLAGGLRSVHAVTRTVYESLAATAHGADAAFTRAFEEWVARNGHGDRERPEQFRLAAGLHAYLRATETLATTVRGTEAGASWPLDDDLFAAFPESERTDRLLASFAADVERTGVERLEGDLLGDVYEALIPADQRAALGQFYTDSALAETVCRWAIPGPDADSSPWVLDPAAGSGAFLRAAAERLDDGSATRSGLGRIAAVDVDRLALRLTALTLAGHGQGEPWLAHDSFFDLDPGDDRLGGGPFDAVVGNPPYIRQEELDPGASHFRRHLSAFGPEGSTPYLDGDRRLSGRSDAYVYFVTHATRFLREGGRLGVVVPAKWLTARYGESFQTFCFDHHRVEAVVGFSGRAFEDALVDTVLLLLERCSDEQERRATTTTFLRLAAPMAPDAIVDCLARTEEPPEESAFTVRDRETHRAVAVDQGHLMDAGGGKLEPYLRAPAAFIRLLEHPKVTELGALGDTCRGVMTGANDFFFLDAADRERWGIDERFLAPAIKSIRDVDGRVVRAGDTGRYLLDVHDYVRSVAGEADGDGPPLESRVRSALARDGHDGVVSYVERGEAEGYHERSSCASRDVWFDLGDLDPPEILHPKFFDERAFVVRNPDRLMPGNAIDCVHLSPSVDEAAMLGVLDSTVTRAMLECWGRAEGGGALQLMTYEVDTLPVPDVRSMDAATRERIVRCHDQFLAGAPDGRDALDRAVLDALGVDLSVERLQTLQAAMTRRRVESGKTAEAFAADPDT